MEDRVSKRVSMKEMVPLIKENIESGGESLFTPSGNSMYPMLRDRQDKVYIKAAHGYLKKYDLPLYERSEGIFVLHRVIKAKDGIYDMRGDNQFAIEKGIKHEQIIGVVSKFKRGDKLYKSNEISYILYTRLWVNTTLLRRLIRGLSRRVKSILRRN